MKANLAWKKEMSHTPGWMLIKSQSYTSLYFGINANLIYLENISNPLVNKNIYCQKNSYIFSENISRISGRMLIAQVKFLITSYTLG